ncbi:uncharacterized protein LOC115326201 [Ixodes scapularis]|uniref:uncharacterized protein LOC115326201 n=1 Tax=Ixodes scapularis TaxID=6945 RepID=UPI001A9DDE44|nr:uncharacterized protein LOC115326201 [Ixodes scapularis]
MDRLKTKRKVRRSQNTKIINEITTMLQSVAVDASSLENLRDGLVTSNEELRKVNEEIEPHISDSDLETDYITVAEYEDEVARTLSELRNKIARLQATPTTSATGADGDRGHPSQATGMELPKLQLLHYQGELTQWQPFWEQFDASIHRNTKLSDVEKFQYLRSLLNEPAASAVSGLQATAACYRDAIEILTERFGDKQNIQREYLERLRNLPMVKSVRDVQGLRNVYDHVQTNIRGLRSLDVSSATYATMMVDILLSSLPTDIVVDYHRHKSYGIPLVVSAGREEGASTSGDGAVNVAASTTDAGEELAKLLWFLRVEIESRERSAPLEERPASVPRIAPKPIQTVYPPSTFALQTSGTDNYCFFCNQQSHSTGACTADIALEEKKGRLAQDMRCFRCTKRGHRSKDCRSQARCSGCRGRHVSSMCNPAWQTTRPVPEETANILTTSNTTPHRASSVLLQTFRSWAVSDESCAYIRGIIDGGSQKTFIREDLAGKLKLKIIGQRSMKLNTFANSGSDVIKQNFTLVRLRLRGQYAMTEYVLEAVVVPFISQDLIETPVEHSFLKAITGSIADELMFPSVQAEEGISLLIGADQMWRSLTGETRRSSSIPGLVAISTSLGWTFQGPTGTVRVLSDTTANLMVCVLGVALTAEDDGAALRNVWELEAIGIRDEPTSTKEQDSTVLEQFTEKISWKNGRYEVALPWKETATTLINNYITARSRLRSLIQRLKHDDSIALYDKAIRNYFEDGHAEEVNENQLQNLFNQKEGNVDNSAHITSIKSHEVTKVLGLVWDKTTDSFTFSSDHLLEILSTNMTTKRFVLRASARIFDPLGFLSPYVIRVKILFQRIWQHGLGWDEELPEALRQEWTTWCAELKDLPRIMAPRHLQNADGESKLELHVFTDASPQAYDACAYLRAVDRKENVSVTLVFAKSRVAPLKTLTLPRLELMGALLGARMAKYLCTVLFGVVVTLWYWTDSMITLGWIKGSATAWKPFVGNRVTEIQALSDPSNWHHCPGSANPADALTRGKTVMQLSAYQLWWSGPEWLSREEGNWPIGSTSEDEDLNGIDGERRQQVGEILLTTVRAPTALLTLENFSSYTKMLRVTAWIK